MSRFVKELTKAAKSSYYEDVAAAILECVTSGDDKGLARAKSKTRTYSLYWLSDVWPFLAHPSELSGEEKRAMHAAVVLGNGEDLARWLTTEEDGQLELPAKGDVAIGIVHPLELSPEQRQAWASHLADYDVRSPFLQLERPVVFPADNEKQITTSTKYRGTSLNAMTFKGRAERLGWQRGSVCDGGGITSYRKSFPDAGADAILAVDGMYIGIDVYADVKLEQFCFVRGGSVSFGSYTYDEPSNEKDERLLAFGEVPPIVYSEILGDLGKIVGQKEEEEVA